MKHFIRVRFAKWGGCNFHTKANSYLCFGTNRMYCCQQHNKFWRIWTNPDKIIIRQISYHFVFSEIRSQAAFFIAGLNYTHWRSRDREGWGGCGGERFLGAFINLRKVTVNWVMSIRLSVNMPVCPYVITRFLLDGFPRNLIFVYF